MNKLIAFFESSITDGYTYVKEADDKTLLLFIELQSDAIKQIAASGAINKYQLSLDTLALSTELFRIFYSDTSINHQVPQGHKIVAAAYIKRLKTNEQKLSKNAKVD